MAGYSGTPLTKKLGIKENFKVCTFNAPANYMKLLLSLPDGVIFFKKLQKDLDMIHLFSTSKSELSKVLKQSMGQIKQNGMIWVSWPKKSSKIPSEISEDTVREVALPLGMVDVKVCAVDEIWSGLKLVIRKENRTE
jgi:hypothetical protein